MLKIYEARSVFQINRQRWDFCGSHGWVCKDESEVQNELILLNKCDFTNARREICEKHLDGVYSGETTFRHRPFIAVKRSYSTECEKFFAEDVHSFSYKIIYREMNDITLEWIARHLTTDEVIRYFKERGMSMCPIKSL